jgi:predicted ATPase
MPTVSMRRVVLTGGPGAGKTTLLRQLAAMGYATVGESARAIIAERLARGAGARPDSPTFAREILRRDIEKYFAQPQTSALVFFDRGVIDAVGFLQEVSPLPAGELAATLSAYPFYPLVFMLPPWEAIYTNDAERDQSFAEAIDVLDAPKQTGVVVLSNALPMKMKAPPDGGVGAADLARHLMRPAFSLG